MATTKTSVDLSVPKARKVRGYLIDRMPIGRFLKAAQLLEGAPGDILTRLFPSDDAKGMLAQLKGLTQDGFQALILRAFTVLPGYAVRLFSELTGLEEEKIVSARKSRAD